MTTAPELPAPPLQQQSAPALASMLRLASNRLEMLRSPDSPHHEDDRERRRIQVMSGVERSALHQECMKIIVIVRAELRRRGPG